MRNRRKMKPEKDIKRIRKNLSNIIYTKLKEDPLKRGKYKKRARRKT